MSPNLTKRHLTFTFFSLALILVFSDPIRSWIDFVQETRRYSHLFLIPPVSLFLIWRNRAKIFQVIGSSAAGLVLLILGAALSVFLPILAPQDHVTWAVVGIVVTWIGGFILIYGNYAFKVACFPLLFLFLSAPLPSWVFERLMGLLQTLSIDLSYFLFKVAGIPIFREGAHFSLPHYTMEVAEECSGIRSALTFLVLSVLLAGTFLRKKWTRILLPLTVIPIVIVENAVRIVGMYLLAIYIHEDFLIPGPVHNMSGTVVFGGALFLLFLPSVALLRWGESKSQQRAD